MAWRSQLFHGASKLEACQMRGSRQSRGPGAEAALEAAPFAQCSADARCTITELDTRRRAAVAVPRRRQAGDRQRSRRECHPQCGAHLLAVADGPRTATGSARCWTRRMSTLAPFRSCSRRQRIGLDKRAKGTGTQSSRSSALERRKCWKRLWNSLVRVILAAGPEGLTSSASLALPAEATPRNP